MDFFWVGSWNEEVEDKKIMDHIWTEENKMKVEIFWMFEWGSILMTTSIGIGTKWMLNAGVHFDVWVMLVDVGWGCFFLSFLWYVLEEVVCGVLEELASGVLDAVVALEEVIALLFD